jgi:hypothetical protein
MDFGKIFDAIKIPIVVLIVLNIIGIGLWFLKNFLISGIWGLISLVVGILTVGYVGYTITKNLKLGLVEAGVGGAMASLISGIVNAGISVVLMLSGINLVGAVETDAAVPGAFLLTFYLVGAVIGLVIGAVVGFVIGLIGGFVGQKF